MTTKNLTKKQLQKTLIKIKRKMESVNDYGEERNKRELRSMIFEIEKKTLLYVFWNG